MKRLLILVLMVLVTSMGFAQARPSFDQIGVGTGKFSDGTAAAPSITFGDDPDTGIYKYSDGVVGIAGGGNVYARFADGALVFHASQTQISPSTSSGDDTGALLLGGGGGMGSARGGSIWLYGNQLASGSIQMSCGNITGSTFSVFTGGASRMVITHPGNVLIGTTTDDGVNKLQVSGSIAHAPITSGLAYRHIQQGSSSLANDGVLVTTITGTAYTSGTLFVMSGTEPIPAIIDIIGTGLNKRTGSTSNVTTTKDNALTLNVYIEDNVVKIQNKRGAARSIVVGYDGVF